MGNREQLWDWRETVGVRLEDESGRVGFGEIAPLTGFGGESFADAIAFLHCLGDSVDSAALHDISGQLPASAFGLSSALHRMANPTGQFKLRNTAFLGDTRQAMQRLKPATKAGFCHFKIKLGVAPVAQEIQSVKDLLSSLPDGGKLRLDANGAFEWQELEQWIDNFADNLYIEFMEQPLSKANTIRHFADLVSTHPIFPMALDESIQSPEDWQHFLADCSWPGYAVIKPSLFGSYAECQIAIRGLEDRVVISSAFESPVGARALAALAAESAVEPAVGMGVAGLSTTDAVAASEISENTFEAESTFWDKF